MSLSRIVMGVFGLSLMGAFAWGGGVGSRGGGEATSQAFNAQAWTTYYQLTHAYPKNVPVIDLEKFKATIGSTQVEFVTERLELDGREKDAINDLDTKTISVNESRYAALTAQQQKKLNLHEYLRLMGVDDSNYQVSNPVILALEGDPLVLLEDAANLALVKLAAVSSKSPKAICYDLAPIAPLLHQVIRYSAEVNASTEGKFHSFGPGRLEHLAGKPKEYCKTGKFYTSMGTIEKAKIKGLECYLTLIERDLNIIQADLTAHLKRDSKKATDIWNEYSDRLAKVCR